MPPSSSAARAATEVVMRGFHPRNAYDAYDAAADDAMDEIDGFVDDFVDAVDYAVSSPTGTCSQARHNQLQAPVHRLCDVPRGCSDTMTGCRSLSKNILRNALCARCAACDQPGMLRWRQSRAPHRREPGADRRRRLPCALERARLRSSGHAAQRAAIRLSRCLRFVRAPCAGEAFRRLRRRYRRTRSCRAAAAIPDSGGRRSVRGRGRVARPDRG